MYLRICSFIVYFFSFLFNKLYFNIFKVIKVHMFRAFTLYSIYIAQKNFYYFIFLIILCIVIFCKIYFFVYYYILLFYKIIIKIYINLINILKKKNNKNLNSIFWLYWFNLLIHLKVLNRKFQNKIDSDLIYYNLKWSCLYFYFYIIYMFMDLISIFYWLILQIVEYQWYILYLQIIFYLKIKKLECIYYIKLFIKGFLGIYCFSGIISYIKKPVKWSVPKPKNKNKNKNASFVSRIKFKYHRSNRIIKEKFYNNVKKPLFILNYFLNNLIESIFFVLLKTGANSIIYYFYKIMKYTYSICVYLWKSDVIYRFFKLIERKKW